MINTTVIKEIKTTGVKYSMAIPSILWHLIKKNLAILSFQ